MPMSNIKQYGYRKPRFKADFRLWLETEGPNARMLDARCFDLGEDGLGAQLADRLQVNSRVKFVFSLPHSPTSVHIAAKVVSCNEHTHGFMFLYSSQLERDFIHQCLADLCGEKVGLSKPTQSHPRR
jgi:hypothetical protein